MKRRINYRRIWEAYYTACLLPGVEIHHIDGDHTNNDPLNLLAVTPEEHYYLHLENNEYWAAGLLSERANVPLAEVIETRKKSGKALADSLWVDSSNEVQERIRDRNRSWAASQKNKSYEEIYGEVRAAEIKKSISIAGTGKVLDLSGEERSRRSQVMKENNPSRTNELEIQKKISTTMKKNKVNVGKKNGMNTKPKSRLLIADKNSKIHHLKNSVTGEEAFIKNITQWAKNNNVNPNTVLVYFSKNKPVNNWLRIASFRDTEITEFLVK